MSIRKMLQLTAHVVFSLLFTPGGVWSCPDEQRLINDLMRGYNTLERPVANESEALALDFGLTLQQIMSVDEKNQGGNSIQFVGQN